MKRINVFLLMLCVVGCMSCNYLDIVPDENATEEDAFMNPTAVQRYLYSCYAYMQNPRHATASLDLMTGDDIVTAWEHENFAKFAQGNYTPTNPVINYWNELYKGIRQCYLLKANVGTVPGLPQELKDAYTTEADFLIAYYHYYLLRVYGPIILVKDLIDMNNPGDPSRSPYDECVSWIAESLKTVAGKLPLERQGDEYGRATSIAAMAIRARLLLYAASPQFNGGEKFRTMYANFKNPDGTQMISTTYDPQKWKDAVKAYQEVLAMTEGKYSLYKTIPNTLVDTPEPSVEPVRTLRFTILDKNNPEIIWAWCKAEETYALQGKSVPRWGKQVYGGLALTLRQIERFYTENGLPIDVDPAYNYSGRYGVVTIPEDWKFGEPGLETLAMNMQREPRFYAWVSFHNNYYEVQGEDKTNGIYSYASKWKRGPYKQLVQYTKLSNMGVNSSNSEGTKTGYLNKKGAHPGTSISDKAAVMAQYPWPMVRLGEIYLGYAEACIEAGELDEGKKYLNYIRERAGIPSVEQAWGSIGVVLDQDRLREIVRRERQIEFYLENHNFWDLRRWGEAETLGEQPMGLSVLETDIRKFAKPTVVDVQRRFIPAHYLLPIPISEISINPNMVQNPGYAD